MTLNTYASVRSTPTGITFATASGGSLSGGTTLYFFAQTRNRVGLSLHSASTALTPAAGQKVVCTIGSSAIATGEDVREVWISASTTNNASTAKLIGIWRYRNALTLDGFDYPGEGTPKSLPATVEFTRDAMLTLNGSVANSAALPGGISLINGMLREVADQAEVWRWDSEATAGELSSGGGYWVIHSRGFLIGDSFSTYYGTSTTLLGGCDRPIEDLSGDEYILSPPPYNPDGSTQDVPLVLWLSNGLTDDTGAILSAGTKLAAQVKVNGENRSTAFSGKVVVRLLGYVDRATGVLDTDIDTVGADVVLGGTAADETPRLTGLEIPEDMVRGQAAAYSLSLQFSAGEIPGLIEDASISVILYPSGELGTLNTALGAVVGDVVFAEGDRLRIVPSAGGFRRLSGAAIVKDYTTPYLSATDFSGLANDTAAQKIAISGSLGGFCVVRSPLTSLLTTEALRAIVSTEAGEYTASGYTSVLNVAVANAKGLQITISYPCTAGGLGTVRSNYPDTRIAGNGQGSFNAPRLRVYVNNGSTITRLTQEITVTPGVSQTFTITSLAGTTVATLPNSAANPDFNLWGYEAIAGTVIDTSSTIGTGNYQIAVAYYYPSPNSAVTKINHDPGVGCITELGSTLVEAASISDYWGDPVVDEAALAGVSGDNIGKARYVASRDRLSRRTGTGHQVWEWALLNEIGVFQKPQGYTVQAIAIATNEITIDFSASAMFLVNLTENINAITVSGMQSGTVYHLILKQDGTGGRSVNGWGSEFKFVNAALPTVDSTANSYTLIGLLSPDGVDVLVTSVTSIR